MNTSSKLQSILSMLAPAPAQAQAEQAPAQAPPVQAPPVQAPPVPVQDARVWLDTVPREKVITKTKADYQANKKATTTLRKYYSDHNFMISKAYDKDSGICGQAVTVYAGTDNTSPLVDQWVEKSGYVLYRDRARQAAMQGVCTEYANANAAKAQAKANDRAQAKATRKAKAMEELEVKNRAYNMNRKAKAQAKATPPPLPKRTAAEPATAPKRNQIASAYDKGCAVADFNNLDLTTDKGCQAAFGLLSKAIERARQAEAGQTSPNVPVQVVAPKQARKRKRSKVDFSSAETHPIAGYAKACIAIIRGSESTVVKVSGITPGVCKRLAACFTPGTVIVQTKSIQFEARQLQTALAEMDRTIATFEPTSGSGSVVADYQNRVGNERARFHFQTIAFSLVAPGQDQTTLDGYTAETLPLTPSQVAKAKRDAIASDESKLWKAAMLAKPQAKPAKAKPQAVDSAPMSFRSTVASYVETGMTPKQAVAVAQALAS